MTEQSNTLISNLMKAKLIAGAVVIMILGVLYYKALPDHMFEKPLSTVLLARDARLLSARIASDGQWRFPARDSIPEKFKMALITFEDKAFYSHHGVHVPSIFRAIYQNISEGKRASGGSTITMQTVRLMRDNPPRTYIEKLYEIILATRLEWSFDKEDIIRMWASNAPYGGNVVGIDAASWRYFGRDAQDLSWAESATLAVLPNAPSLIFPGKNQERLIQKRNRLLIKMRDEGILDSLSCELAIDEPVPGPPKALPQSAFHLMQTLEQEKGSGICFESSIDFQLQQRAEGILERHAIELAKNRVYNLCAIITRVNDGSVAAYVGNVKGDDLNSARHVDIIQAPRSTGSILKPLLFAGMLNDGELLPDMLISDTPVRMGSFAPKNYNESYDGVVPASQALSRSLNIPAVHLLENYGVEKFHRLLQDLGFNHLSNAASHYGLSLILGGAEASLWEVANAYTRISRDLKHYSSMNAMYPAQQRELISALSNDSTDNELSAFAALNAASIYLTFQALQKVNRPGNEEGWEMFSSSSPMAWKTGTSYGFRDAWSVGCTPEYVISVWAGNAGGEGRPGLTGVTAAAPVLFDLADLVPVSSWFSPPYDDMKSVPVCAISGYPPSQHCREIDTLWVPIAEEKVKPCPFHKLLHLAPQEDLQANSNCFSASALRDSSWFELNPVQAWYYRKKHSNYRPAPNWHPLCMDEANTRTMQFIYPLPNQKIYLPIELDTRRGQVVFEAAHNDVNTTVYWHLDKEFLGTSKELHKMTLEPEEGSHVITLIDDKGNSIDLKFDILDKSELQ